MTRAGESLHGNWPPPKRDWRKLVASAMILAGIVLWFVDHHAAG